ncbi:MAG: S-layer homology domain-containing protein, partial [Evtepia sp.]|nr:S-layer homology domain-containing protein [Evtepia sp.]
MKKRLLSILFTLALCLALLSVTALAADTVDYGVTVNGVAVTSDNVGDVLSDSNPGKVSYDAETNTLTINGGLTNAGSPTATVIQGNGTTDVKIDGGESPAVFGLTVTGAKNVTVTANSNSPAIYGSSTGVGANITCSGDVEIVNKGGGQAVRYTLTFQQSNGHSYTVKTKTGSSQDALTIYAEKAAGETFGPVSLEETVSAVKIESAGHTPGEWEHIRTQHWQVCTACGAELDRADHTFIGRTCTVCGYTRPSTSGGVSTYAITVENAKNGDVTSSHKTASKGTTVTLTVEPGKGYTLETLTVTDKSGSEIELTNKGDGKYTFTMPASKVTVTATFMEDNSMLNFFVDVPADAYYYDAVLWAVENGVTEGTNADGTLFSPNDPCTRAQVVTFLWRAAGSPEPESLRSFADVSADSYYAKAVAWAVENGITTGTGDGLFSPDAVCSRAQIVTFLWRAQQSPAAGSANPFLDVAADAYYTDAVLWAVENGVTMGTNAEGTAFSPDDDCTRAQIVTFLYRCLG